MANAILAYGNLIDAALMYGGGWRPAMPLTNLQDRRLGKLARSATAAAADTWFDADFGGPRLFRVVALVNHNLTVAARYRIRLSLNLDLSAPVADSGWQDVWPTVYPFAALPWGAPNWWTGKYPADQIEAYTGTLVFVLSNPVNARFIRIELSDPTNPEGCVEAGRMFAADGWQPVRNMSYGATLAWEARTEVQEALSGAEYFNARTPVRVARFGLEAMSEAEAMTNAFEIQRSMGVGDELLFIWDPEDTTHALRRQFLCRMRTLSPIENPGPNRWKAPFEVKELL